MIVLAGDIHGTHSRFALYRDADTRPFFERAYKPAEHATLDTLLELVLEDARRAHGQDGKPARACFGLPGPVENDTCRVTPLPWVVDARKLESRTKIGRVTLLNNFQATALGVTVLPPEHLIPLGGGERNPTGAIVTVGAGTGLGEAFLVWSPAENRYLVLPSEGGHVEFTPRTSLESGLLHYLGGRYGRVTYERVLSTAGLGDIYSFLAGEAACRAVVTEETRNAMIVENPVDVIVRQGLSGRDPVCVITLNIFSSILGGLAGNLALTVLASGGVFIAGDIAPRIAAVLQNGTFREAFEAKGRFQPLVARMPAFLVTYPDVGLLGAFTQAMRT